MSAKYIYDHAPIGSIIRYSDGTPRPPDRHRKKLADWKRRNGSGQLIRKQPERRIGTTTILPASITLWEGVYASNGVVIMLIHNEWPVEYDLKFSVAERPTPGSIRIMSNARENAELLHMAANREAAETWLLTNSYPDAVLDEVPHGGRAAS